MVNEIHANYSSGNTLYSIVRDKEGNVWNPAGDVFESWGTDGRDAEDYCLSLVDMGGSFYMGDFDGNIPPGRYYVQIFLQAGANPEDGDNLVESMEYFWSGTGRITSDKLLANKAVQNKASGQIQYYDDDAQSVLVTLTPSENQDEVTRECN